MRTMRTEYSATVELPRGRDSRGRFTPAIEVDVTVTADVDPPVKPTIRMDPDDCDPGEPGGCDIISVVRDDTGDDITNQIDLSQLEAQGIEQGEDDAQSAYEDAMEARAEERREREWEGDF